MKSKALPVLVTERKQLIVEKNNLDARITALDSAIKVLGGDRATRPTVKRLKKTTMPAAAKKAIAAFQRQRATANRAIMKRDGVTWAQADKIRARENKKK